MDEQRLEAALDQVDDMDVLRDVGHALEPYLDDGRHVRARSKRKLREKILAACLDLAGNLAIDTLESYGILTAEEGERILTGPGVNENDDSAVAPGASEADDDLESATTGEDEDEQSDDDAPSCVFIQLLAFVPRPGLRANDIVVDPFPWITERFKHAVLTRSAAISELDRGRRLNTAARFSQSPDVDPRKTE